MTILVLHQAVPPHLQQNCAREYDTVMSYGVVPLAHSVKDRKVKNTSCSMLTGLFSMFTGRVW